MNRLHVLVLLAAMACTGLVMGTAKAEAADSGKELRAAVNATAPPFAFMENGKLVGFEVDLHAEVAKRMGKQLVMTNIPFAGLAPGLQAKKWDAAGNTWINKERLVMMDFSDPWVDAQLAFVTRKNDAITSPEQLKGKTVGAEAGGSTPTCANRPAPSIRSRITPCSAWPSPWATCSSRAWPSARAIPFATNTIRSSTA